MQPNLIWAALADGESVIYIDLPPGQTATRSFITPQATIKNADIYFLIDDGYQMIQYSVYARACVTFARQETHLGRVKQNLPEEGSVRALFVTRAQWERSFVIQGSPASASEAEEMPDQIQLW